jgi:amino acid adenylation domain-containing protein
LFTATEAWFGFGADDVWTLFHSYAFDFSVWEIWGALAYGGRLVVVPLSVSRAPVELYDLLSRDGVTVLNQTPSAFHNFSEMHFLAKRLPKLRLIIFGGEALSLVSLKPWFSSNGDKKPCLVNMYGITETTVHVTYRPLCEEDLLLCADSVIGRSIQYLQIYVLDPCMDLMPIGVAGELHIGGAGLARGYLGRPGLTAERFVPSPFREGERLYRTGDLARWRSDGELEYLGRIDHQVKLRGYRIELGEIEAALLLDGGVTQAAVVAREDVPGEKRLVAYVVGRGNVAPEISALRAHLQRSLPDYMVPSAFVALEALPLTPNGKIDRRALPVPEAGAGVVHHAYEAPRTPTEEALSEIWRDVLRLDRVGVHDNFFELGGHSLLATRVVARVCEVLEVELPLRAMFEAPTIAGLGERIEAARCAGTDVVLPPLVAHPRGEALPLSYAQERLWFLEHFGVGPAYDMPGALRLEGALDVGALDRSFGEVVRRHEVLRTRFEVVDGDPVQVIDGIDGFRLGMMDLSELGKEEREAQARRLAREDAEQPFDLARGPLFRAMLVRLAAVEHVLLVNMHHIVSDGWSLGVLVREIGALYGAYVAGRSSPLPELAVQYADYAVWQRGWLKDEALAQQVGYWKERLSGAPAALDLPTDRPRPSVQSFKGAVHGFELSRELTTALARLARAEGATLYMVLLAAFQVLLRRYSGQEDIVVGSPIAGRRRYELEGLIGFFVNTLALRTDLSGDPSFRELLKRVKEVALGAYAHQDLPFEKLVEVLQPVRDLSRSPLVQVCFALQNMPGETLQLPGLELQWVGVEGLSSKFDLSVFMFETVEGLGGHIEYATALFDASTIDRFVDHFETLLEGIVAGPDRRISELPLLSVAERHQLVAEWNGTAADYPGDRCLHELFTAQAAKTPDAVAVIFEGQQLTYAELDRRSNQLAHHLRGLGIGPETVVGICVERSLEMVVGLLGILKAGGAYLPLDPSYPQERLAFMLEDARASILVTQAALLQQLPAHAAQVVRLDADHEEIARQSTAAPASNVGPDNLAYVIYTSGSTGKPKGVMNTHCSIVNRLWWMQDAYDLTPADRVLQKTPFGFDVSVWEFFWPLMFGARLIVARPAGHKDPSYLADLVWHEGVTIMHFVPSMLQEFLEVADLVCCGSLRDVVCSGEALPVDTQNKFLAQLPSRLHNLYGPTEAAVDVSAWHCKLTPGSTHVPIGHPINNISLYVLDRLLEPVPIGVAGELYIGGVGLARGYLGRPGLTAERFVPSPFREGERLYRTGDLARWRSDGELEYLGRIDQQVKLRGYRIELSEIEATLATHPDVRQAVVVAREDEPGEKRLVAYVVAQADAALERNGLRAHLKMSLPDYMVPFAFVMLAALPLTPNGKVDRRALPVPEAGAGVVHQDYEAPRTPVEEALSEIWREVLRLERVGVHDNFFELGGHSLLATRVMARVCEVLRVELPLRAMFEAPSILELGERVAAAQRAGLGEGVRNDV